LVFLLNDVRDTALVKRLFDFFIVSHPLMVVYMSVAMMIHPLNRIEVLSADCDFACVHNAWQIFRRIQVMLDGNIYLVRIHNRLWVVVQVQRDMSRVRKMIY